MILALDTSACQASLALWDPIAGVLRDEAAFPLDRTHFGMVFDPLSKAVETWREQLTGFAVGLGPGSYTAVRVGLAAMQGLSLSLGLPLVGRNSLETFSGDEASYAVLGDARRHTWALTLIRNGLREGETQLLGETALAPALASLRDQGVPLFSAERAVLAGDFGAVEAYPSAATLACRSVHVLQPEALVNLLEPIYLRDPFITYPRGALAPTAP
jgi:tRNA threonylcarbamoyl adenosine modification protein YeaZ